MEEQKKKDGLKDEAKEPKNPQCAKDKKTPKAEDKAEQKKTEEEPEPEKPENKIDQLEKDLAAAKEALSKEKDDYMRLMAEFETFRRRTAEERLNLIGSAATDTIKGLLPVLDDCKRALELLEKSADEAAKEGTNLIYTKLMAYLKTKGLEEIKAKGEKFDTDFHEAVAQLPTEDEAQKGHIFDVVETGYTLNGKIIRYAKVVVSI